MFTRISLYYVQVQSLSKINVTPILISMYKQCCCFERSTCQGSETTPLCAILLYVYISPNSVVAGLDGDQREADEEEEEEEEEEGERGDVEPEGSDPDENVGNDEAGSSSTAAEDCTSGSGGKKGKGSGRGVKQDRDRSAIDIVTERDCR